LSSGDSFGLWQTSRLNGHLQKYIMYQRGLRTGNMGWTQNLISQLLIKRVNFHRYITHLRTDNMIFYGENVCSNILPGNLTY